MFQQKQGCVTSTTQSHSDNSKKQDLFDSSTTQDKQADIQNVAHDKQYGTREFTVPESSKTQSQNVAFLALLS